MNITYFVFFLFILGGTLTITYWASQRESTTHEFYSVSGSLTGVQNGLAIAGDYMSAASFLGITGAIALNGFDGFFYAIGFLVSYLLLLFLVAEPVRRLGTFTLGDVICARFPEKKMRFLSSSATIAISILYIIPQLVAAGLLIHLLLNVEYEWSVIIVGLLMTFYIVFGGMMAASWVQIVKTVLLMGGTFLISLIVLSRFDWNVFHLIEQVTNENPLGKAFFQAGNLFKSPLETLSLNFTLLLGTAGLPHILIRFFTVKNAQAVRKSVITATWLIGLFYFMTLLLGLGVVVFVGQDQIAASDPSGNLAAPMLAYVIGGDFLMAFISAVAFATVLAVVTGLVITATTSFAYDIYNHLYRDGKATDREQLRMAKFAAVAIGLISILLSLGLKGANVTFLVSLTFAVAASTNLPLLLFTLYWRRFNAAGAITGVATGLVSSLLLVVLGPNLNPEDPIVFFANPGIVSIPLGFLGAVSGTLLSKHRSDEERFHRMLLKAMTGNTGRNPHLSVETAAKKSAGESGG
ncbi:MAG TPA: cation acetate symporter [Bacillales bacterium]|nr:cation acetate symporter [Bacillales bacterium]